MKFYLTRNSIIISKF